MTRCRFLPPVLIAGLIVLPLMLGPLAPARDEPAKDTKPAAPALSPEQRQRNLESFEYVWKTVRDTYWDPKMGGLNWQAVHDELRPRMEKADTMAAARAVLQTMLQRLGQSHFGIIPRAAYRELAKAKDEHPASSRGVAGFDVRVIGEQVLVVAVTADTPAAKLGVRPGWQVVKIAGAELAPALTKVRAAAKTNSHSLDFLLYRAVLGRLHGNEGDKLAVGFRDGRDKDVALDIPLVPPQGVKAQFGNLPAFYVHVVTRKLEPHIAYFGLSTFFDPESVMKAFEQWVEDNRRADGLIIDIRGNPGGLGLMAAGIGSWFVRQPDLNLGTMTLRSGKLLFLLNPRLRPYEGPLAILVDGCSVSTSEILAGGMQDLKRAKIFGSRTAGAALPSVVEKLPNGDGFQYAIADYVSAGGRRLEGAGVTPDVEAPLTRQALLDGWDPALGAAVRWIASQPPRSK